MLYILTFSYLEEDFDESYVDSHIMFTNITNLQNYLKQLLRKHPNAIIHIFKALEMEMSDFYEFKTKA